MNPTPSFNDLISWKNDLLSGSYFYTIGLILARYITKINQYKQDYSLLSRHIIVRYDKLFHNIIRLLVFCCEKEYNHNKIIDEFVRLVSF